MKHKMTKRLISLFLCLVMIFALFPTITPTARADNFEITEVERETYEYFSGPKTWVVSISYQCGNGCMRFLEFDPRMESKDVDIRMAVVNDLSEIDRKAGEHGYCEDCYEEYLCVECFKEKSGCEHYCESCHMCGSCWDKSNHCEHCNEENDLCAECVARGDYRCDGCHDLPPCDGCGRCLVSAEAECEHCLEGGNHCTDCDEPWICSDCGSCFYDRPEYFCETCEMCLECAALAGEHCINCYGCFNSETDPCEGNDELCIDCCFNAGYHCQICLEHVEDWCDGGMDCEHCYSCADDEGWLCEQCGLCCICNDFDFCEECGLCYDCCMQNASEEGCVCLEYCVESGEFSDPEHLCEQCFSNFSCSEEFCDTCGLCMECCEMNTDEYGCTCGLCVEDSEFQEHICEQCGLPTCEQGDFCPDCGLCETCCLENSEAEGCTCGLCVESSDFEDPEHRCSECGEFSCNVDFCEHCGLCADCCEANTYSEYGCSHGVCMEDPDWGSHYCAECDKCKEDCDCGQDCCADAWTGWSGAGTPVQIGSILMQPTDKKRGVSTGNSFDRAENTVVFRTRAYDPNSNLSYQWYRRRDGGAPEALVDHSVYVEFVDETLVFLDGATTPTLTVSVPTDACHVDYVYYCIVSSPDGELLAMTDQAKLIGAHTYKWQWTDEHYHQQVCIGSGCGHKRNESKKAHEIGPWRYVRFATETLGAKIVRSCNVCGGVSETRETAALGEAHNTHDYLYVPVESVNGNGETVCITHIKQCICGRTEGGEEPHVWDRWIVTEQANDHHRGSKYRECMLCHYRQTEIIPIQTHEHEFNLHEYDAEFYRVDANNRYHWQFCGDPECEAEAFKEEHTYSHWFWETAAGTPQLDWRDATVYRYCEVCGYVQERTIKKENRPLCFNNADATAISADKWDSEEKFTYTVTAQPHAGYYFVRWDDTGEGRIVYEDVKVQKKNAYGTPLFDEYGNPIYEYRQCTRYDETITISLDHYDEAGHYLGLNTLYELDAVCERFNNDLRVYYNDGNSNVIDYGYKLTQSELDGKTPYAGEPWVLWYEKQEEDDYGYRTVTVHLRNYDGGPIYLMDTGLPCDLHVIVDDDSNISTNDKCYGIMGCYTGGNVMISSPNGAELRINVRNDSYLFADTYAIKAQRDKKWYQDKVTLCGSVLLQASVTNPKAYGHTYGIYSNSWVEILDDASAEISVCSYAYSDSSSITASAIRAKKEIQIDTTGYLQLYASTDVDSEKKARPLNAKNIIIDNISLMEVTYPTISKNAYRREPDYDHRAFMFYTYEDGTRYLKLNGEVISAYPVTTLRMEPAYPVSFTVDQGATLNVYGQYQNDQGDYMVRPGESLEFYTAPAAGHYDERVQLDGEFLKRGEVDDGVRTKYVIGPVDSAHSVKVGTGQWFRPFASQPELSQSDVYYGSDAYLSYRMNAVQQVMKSHELFSASDALDPKFALGGTSGNYCSGELIDFGLTKNRVFLQRYNPKTGLFENTGIDYAPSVLGTVSFNDMEVASLLGTYRYRLMVLYDGQEYPSEEFSINWTNDPNDTTEPRTTAVELYIADGKNANGGRCYDGGAWVRLDGETEYLVYDVSGGDWIGRAMSKEDYVRNRKTSDLLIFAEFDYHTGTLTLNGDFYYLDFDGDGEEEWYDLGGQIKAIRVPDDASGTLVIDVKTDTWIEGDYDAFGWEAWVYGDGMIVRGEQVCAQTDVILNENGGVRVTSQTGAVLDLDRSGSMAHADEERSYAGINASGDISVEGDVVLMIGMGLNSDSVWWNNYGADRCGLESEGTISVRDSAELQVHFPVPEGRHMIGASIAMHAAAVELTDDSVTILDCNSDSIYDNWTCYVLSSESLNVTGSARLTITARGDIPIPIWVDGDILLATDDTVSVNALGSGDSTNCFEYAGELHLSHPTTLRAQYRNGTEEAGLVYYLEPIPDGDYVFYQLDTGDPGLTEEVWYPGTPYSVTVETDEGADANSAERFPTHIAAVARGDRALFAREGEDPNLDVCVGDRVTYVAAEAIPGYEFVGWSFEDCVAPEDLVADARRVSFTMPGYDLKLHAVYACTAFQAEPPCFVITGKDADEGILYWRVDADIPNVYSVELEYLTTNEAGEDEWVSFLRSENGYWRGWDMKEDMKTYRNPQTGEVYYAGASRIGRAGVSELPRAVDTDVCGTYRIFFNGNVDYYSRPFTIDFDKGVHILLSQDRDAAELSIPADYAGTEYLVDLSKYLYSEGGQMSYSLYFADIAGPINGEICEATLFENGMLRFVRNGAHAPIYGIEGGTFITATDEESGRSFTIPFDFGEIYGTTTYPVIVAGRKITERNKDDVLGDGTVSYDPETGTLTLDNATISEIYAIRSDAQLTSGAYAIASAKDLTVRLVGENGIYVSRNSFCHSQPYSGTYKGTVVGVGTFINDSYRPYLTESDAFRVNFTGEGSLRIEIDGEVGEGIHSIGDVTIDGPDVTVQSKYSGISSEEGSFTMNSGSLDVDVDERSCVELSARNARFTVNGGRVHLSGGTDACTVSMSAVTYQNADYFQLLEGEMILETKSPTWDLVNRSVSYNSAVYDVLYSDGRPAGEAVEAPDTIETLDYLQFLRKYPIWVNGEQFNTSRMTIRCGKGTATYDPETNTVYLHNVQITKGVAFWDGPQAAAGIYALQPVLLSFSGYSNRIDLSAKDYYTTSGAPYELLDEESEAGRYVYGIYARNRDSEEEELLGISGSGQCKIQGVRYGVTSNGMPIRYDGPSLSISGCEGGIDGDVTILDGSVTVDAEYYCIYGCLNTEDYYPLYAIGGATLSESALLDWSTADAATDQGWGYDYPYFMICHFDFTQAPIELGQIASEEADVTTIRINPQFLPKDKPVKVIVAQYKNDRLEAVRIAEVDPGDDEAAILLTFGTAEDAVYCVFVVDPEYKPLQEACDVGG